MIGRERFGLPPECREARERVQHRLDAAERLPQRDRHLDGCAACREYARGLEELTVALRALPSHPFPDDALEEVWARTVDAEPSRGVRAGPFVRFAAAAAAAAIAAALVWTGGGGPGTPPAPDAREVARARREVRLVLGLTSRALHRTETAALHDVLGERVSPAIARTRVDWPELHAPRPSRRREGA